jgi:hypothetical protein
VVLDRPLQAGAVVVSGSGPAGLLINIVNVTDMGSVLGTGSIGPDNRFSISVTPLPGSVRVGVGVIDVGTTGKDLADFNAKDYQGVEPLVVPQVGYFLDTVLVSSP